MSSKTGFRIARCKPVGWIFAFILSATQMYPAFGACICLQEIQETVEVSASTEVAPSCKSPAARPATRAEMDSGIGRCSQEADCGDSNTRISRDDCCGVDSGRIPPLPSSLSRTVETRPAFDAIPWSRSDDTGTLVPRSEGPTRGPESGYRSGLGTSLFLINASLLI